MILSRLTRGNHKHKFRNIGQKKVTAPTRNAHFIGLDMIELYHILHNIPRIYGLGHHNILSSIKTIPCQQLLLKHKIFRYQESIAPVIDRGVQPCASATVDTENKC